MKKIDKVKLLTRLRERVSAGLATLTESQRATQAGATHEEARAEHAKDTRATEASYLARGLAERVLALEAEVALLASQGPVAFGEEDAIGMMALVGLEDGEGAESVILIAPAGAGERIEIEGLVVRIVTSASPLGRSLMSRRVGDEFEIRLPGGVQEVSVCWIQ